MEGVSLSCFWKKIILLTTSLRITFLREKKIQNYPFYYSQTSFWSYLSIEKEEETKIHTLSKTITRVLMIFFTISCINNIDSKLEGKDE